MAVGATLALFQRTLPALAEADLPARLHGIPPVLYVVFRTLDGPQALAFYVGCALFAAGSFLRRRARKSDR